MGLVGCLVCAWSVAAQTPDPVGIAAGTRVRVGLEQPPPLIGSVVRHTVQALELSGAATGVRTVNMAAVRSLEVSRGRPVHGGRLAKGALNGFLIVGGAATAIIAASDPGWAFVGPVLFGPVGALGGATWSYAKRPEVWESVPVIALAPNSASGSTIAAASANVSPGPTRAAKPGRGKQIAVGAVIGTIAGVAFAQAKSSSTPTTTRMILIAIPGALLGGAIGAFIP